MLEKALVWDRHQCVWIVMWALNRFEGFQQGLADLAEKRRIMEADKAKVAHVVHSIFVFYSGTVVLEEGLPL